MQSAQIWLDLVLNLTLLIALSILSGFIDKRLPRSSRLGALMQGLLFGGAAVIGMLRPLNMGPGLIFDGRSVMLSLCALFFGPWAAAVASLAALACRIALGGSGTIMGVLVILSSSGIGLYSRFRFKPVERPPSTFLLYFFGLAVHVVMVALMFTLPAGAGIAVIQRLGLPVILLYPLATILAGKILSDHVAAERSVEALKKSEERFKFSMEATKDGLWDWDVGTDKSYYSPAYYGMLGFKEGEFAANGASWQELIHPDDRERVLRANSDCIEGKSDLLEVEYRLRANNGEWRWIYARGKSISRRRDGRAERLVGTHVDITERKRAEENLMRSLEEKGVLLREVHHRVKNNLNIISSLLALQSSVIRDPEQAIAAFDNSRDRILAMALVHEELYKTGDYARVDMQDCLARLASQLQETHCPRENVIVSTEARGIFLDLGASIPCALILNELLTNAFKHAFPDQGPGKIHVSLEAADGDQLVLSVSDDGIGVPVGHDKDDKGSLGFTLVRLLAEQLGGRVEFPAGKGMSCRITFPKRAETAAS